MILNSPTISGSLTVTGNIITSGSITISGSIASASYASNADLLDGLDSTVFTLTSSFAAFTSSLNSFSASVNSFSASQNSFTASILAQTASLNAFSASILSYTASQNILNGTYTLTSSFNAQTASFTAFTSSINAFSASVLTFTGSASTRLGALESYTASINDKTSSFATTGSNTFVGNQVVSGSFTTSGSITSTSTITAQTLVVQTITSSVVYSSGSNIFGNDISNSQTFTGSVLVTGSLTISTGGNASAPTIFGSTIACSPIGCFATSCATSFIGGTMSGTTIYGSTAVCSANGLLIGNGGVTATCNYLPKFTGASTIGNSLIQDDGTTVSITRTAGDLELSLWAGSTTVAGNSILGLYAGTGLGNLIPYGTIKVIPETATNTRAANMVFSTRQSGGTLTESFRIFSTQNIGIGTTTDASYKLDVNGTGRFSDTLTVQNPSTWATVEIKGAGSTQGGQVDFYGSTTRYASIAGEYESSTNGALIFRTLKVGTLTNALTIASTGAATFSSSVYSSGSLQVAPTTGTGMIGLGDNFGGNMNAGIYRGGAGVTTSGNYLNIGGYDGVVITTGAVALGSQTERMRIVTDGRVGINVSPAASTIFHVQDNTARSAVYRLEPYTNAYESKLFISSRSSGDGGIRYGVGGGNEMNIFSYGTMRFNVGSGNISGNVTCERLNINSDGIATFACQVCAPRLDLNRCNAAAVLTVNNENSTDDAGVRGLAIATNRLRFGVSPITSTYGAIATNGTNSGITFVTYDNAWTEKMRIACNGDLTIKGNTHCIYTNSSATISFDINSTRGRFYQALTVDGNITKGGGSFKIDHPLESKKDTYNLYHSFVESPKADLIYRGKVALTDGYATVNIDTAANMSEGTFEVLVKDVQCFTTNENGWNFVKGTISGNILTIESDNTNCNDEISWMVIGERNDKWFRESTMVDENGKTIVEKLKSETI